MAPTVQIHIDPNAYYTVGNFCFGAAQAMSAALDAHLDTVAGCTKIAGSDEGGEAWGNGYNTAANDLIAAAGDAILALENYGRIVYEMGRQWAETEWTNAGQKGSAPTYPADPAATQPKQRPTIDAKGGDGKGIEGLVELADAINIPIPNGNRDKLGTASKAWESINKGVFDGSVVTLQAAVEYLDSSDCKSPDIDYVFDDLEELQAVVEDISTQFLDLAISCTEHNLYLLEVRQEINKQALEMLEDMIVEAAVGAIASRLSLGASRAATAARATELIKKCADTLRGMIAARKAARVAAVGKAAKDVGIVAQMRLALRRFIDMVKDVGKSKGAKNQRKGKRGEERAGIDPSTPKTPISINGRTRIPDKLDPIAGTLTEVKNVNSLSKTKQIQDFLDYSNANGLKMELIVDTRTKLTGPLQQLVDTGQITLKRMPLQ
ncbi:putative toxin [Nocardia sp. NPDC048505]|uniref:putative toxin n=1 Tax=unclassified Nocardia TaxID=2637762 RepID=UPI0033FFD0FE